MCSNNWGSCGKFYRIKSGSKVNPMDFALANGELPFSELEEVSEELALQNPSETITYGFTAQEVESFFRRAQQILIPVPT
jgi:hypothetical protein